MSKLMRVDEAAAYIGKSPQILRRLVYAGVIASTKNGGRQLIFDQDDLDALKEREYPEGMTHRDIAERYGKKRGIVAYHFKRLRAKPMGANRGKGGNGQVYSEATVTLMAEILGWDVQSPTGEASTPLSHAESTSG